MLSETGTAVPSASRALTGGTVAIVAPCSTTSTTPERSFAATKRAPAGMPTRKKSCAGLAAERNTVSAAKPPVVGLTIVSASVSVFV
jgi:hypothetical protein